jgi:hypothetical protein
VSGHGDTASPLKVATWKLQEYHGAAVLADNEAVALLDALAALDGLVWSLDGVWAICSGSPPDSTHPFHPAFDRARAALAAYRRAVR